MPPKDKNRVPKQVQSNKKAKPNSGEGTSGTNVLPGVNPMAKCADKRFVHNMDMARYNDHLYKKFIVERKFNAGSFDPKFHNDLVKDGWDFLLEETPVAYEEMVREFYANLASSTQLHESFVRGKVINFSPSTINEFYGVRNCGYDECEYQDQVNNKTPTKDEVDEVTRRLCGDNRGEWKWQDGKPVEMKSAAQHLDLLQRGVHKLVCNRILPTQHDADVTWARGLMVYSIVQELAVDLGYAICSAILEVAGAHSRASFVMPSLITSLCLKAGVRVLPNEKKLVPMKEISQTSLLNSTRSVGSRTTMRPVSAAQAENLADVIDDLFDRFEDLEERVDDVREVVSDLSGQVEKMGKQMTAHIEQYNKDREQQLQFESWLRQYLEAGNKLPPQ